MIRQAALGILLAIPAVEALAQHVEHGEHAVEQAQQPSESHVGHEAHDAVSTTPAAALSGPRYAADTIFDAEEMAAARAQLRTEHGAFRMQMVLADRFEARIEDGDERYAWDLQGWYGGDIHKLWWKSEGAADFGSNPEDAELQLLYSRAVTPYFDFQAGLRHDPEPSPRRSHAVLGFQGVLPYVFEIDAAAFISDEGDITGRFEAEYDLRIRQRVVLQPRIELDFAAQAIPELNQGAGLGSIEGGLRLRYEIKRELAPYIGFGWERKTGATADLARAAGEDPRSWKLLVGMRAWF